MSFLCLQRYRLPCLVMCCLTGEASSQDPHNLGDEWVDAQEICWENDCSNSTTDITSVAITPDADAATTNSSTTIEEQFDINIDDLVKVRQFEPSSFNGFIATEIAYSYLQPIQEFGFARRKAEVSKIQTTLNASYERKLFRDWKMKISANAFYDFYYQQKGKSRFADETLDAYEYELEFRDTFIEGSLAENLWFKFGKQIVAWGEADFSQVLSLANPVDIRELGRTDIVDALVPVTASKFIYTYNGWQFDAVAIHEIRANKVATEGTDLDIYASIRNPSIRIANDDEPDSDFENTETLLRAFKSFDDGDISMVYADVFANTAHLSYGGVEAGTGVVIFQPEYERFKAIGVSGNFVTGPWLFKAEVGFKKGMAIARNDLLQQIMRGSENPVNTSDKDLVESVVGFTYAGSDNFTLSVESFLSHIQDHEPSLAIEKDSWNHTMMITKDFFQERLHTQLLITYIPTDNGDSQIIRMGADYDYSDDLVFSIGAIFYEANEKSAPLYPYSHSDNVFTSIKLNF